MLATLARSTSCAEDGWTCFVGFRFTFLLSAIADDNTLTDSVALGF